jgi:hypothetical protein
MRQAAADGLRVEMLWVEALARLQTKNLLRARR